MKNWGIQTRILLLALAPAVAIACALTIYFVLALLSDLDRDLRDRGLGLARQLAAIAEYSAYSGDRETLNGVALAALEEIRVSSVEVYDPEGEALAASGALPPPLSLLPPADDTVVIEENEDHLRMSAPIVRHRLEVQDPFLLAPVQRPPRDDSALLGWVVVEVSRQSLEARRKDTIVFTLALVLLTVAVTSLLAMLLVRQVSQPIVRLERAVARIRAGQLDLQLPADSGGDLQRLEEGFNAMARALQEARSNLEDKIRDATRELEGKRDEAERSSQAKSRFLSAASHDLRQPLHALNLFASELSNAARDDEQKKLSTQIGNSIRSMSELLDSLLNISRLDVAGITPQPTPTPVAAIFDRLKQTYGPEAAAKGLRLRFHPGQASVLTDPALLEKLLAQLLTNALRYTGRGSVLLAARKRGSAWRIEVRDSGSGIALQHQKSVFEEFFQVGNTERGEGKGLGLGLAIVSRLARALELCVDLRSALGKGSVFAVEVPACPPQMPGETSRPIEKKSDIPLVALLTYGQGFMEETVGQVVTWLNDWGLGCRRVESREEGKRLLEETAGSGATGFVWLAMGNRQALEELQALGNGLRAVLVTPDEITGTPRENFYCLPHPVRPAKLRALLQRLAEER